jgi:hypothetical protein
VSAQLIKKYLSWSTRKESVSYGGEEFFFIYEKPFGEDRMEVIYPDPVETQRDASHAALVNSRSRPYPPDAVVYAKAILRTLSVSPGSEPPDLTQLLLLFDVQPLMFEALSDAALKVMGLDTGEPEIGGVESWERVHRALLVGEVSRAIALCEGALVALRGDSPEPLELSPILETALGNDSGAIGFPGCDSPLTK